MTLIKSISGIRGTIGGPATENLTPLDIVKFTTAYVRFIAESAPGKRLKIVVGRDARISGEMVGDIIEGTLLGCGADVVNIGLCTTPGTELAVTAHRADGGIIITASHNPRQWNALKLLNAEGEFLSDAEGKRVLALAEDESFVFPDVDHIGKVVSRESYNDEHIRRVLALPWRPAAGRCGSRAEAALQGGRGCGELRRRHRHTQAAAGAGMRSRGAQLRTDRRVRP